MTITFYLLLLSGLLGLLGLGLLAGALVVSRAQRRAPAGDLQETPGSQRNVVPVLLAVFGGIALFIALLIFGFYGLIGITMQ